MNDYIDVFYEYLIKRESFDGDYFKAMVDAIILARAYVYIKNLKGDKNDE